MKNARELLNDYNMVKDLKKEIETELINFLDDEIQELKDISNQSDNQQLREHGFDSAKILFLKVLRDYRPK